MFFSFSETFFLFRIPKYISVFFTSLGLRVPDAFKLPLHFKWNDQQILVSLGDNKSTNRSLSIREWRLFDGELWIDELDWKTRKASREVSSKIIFVFEFIGQTNNYLIFSIIFTPDRARKINRIPRFYKKKLVNWLVWRMLVVNILVFWVFISCVYYWH